MAHGSHWELTPRQSIERESALRGRDAVIDGCIAILADPAGADETLVVALAGPAAHPILSGQSGSDPEMWLRTWALRGLLWAWDDRASGAVGDALADGSWRVREMAVKVIRRNLLGEHIAAVAVLVDDPVERVRVVAEDALRRITLASG